MHNVASGSMSCELPFYKGQRILKSLHYKEVFGALLIDLANARGRILRYRLRVSRLNAYGLVSVVTRVVSNWPCYFTERKQKVRFGNL